MLTSRAEHCPELSKITLRESAHWCLCNWASVSMHKISQDLRRQYFDTCPRLGLQAPKKSGQIYARAAHYQIFTLSGHGSAIYKVPPRRGSPLPAMSMEKYNLLPPPPPLSKIIFETNCSQFLSPFQPTLRMYLLIHYITWFFTRILQCTLSLTRSTVICFVCIRYWWVSMRNQKLKEGD